MLLRGGRNQKRQRLEAREIQVIGGDFIASLRESELAFELVQRWCWGGCSAAEVQRLSQKSYTDQVSLLKKFGIPKEHISSSLRSLAALGASGKYSGNICPELKRFLGEPSYPKPIMFKLNMAIRKPRKLSSKLQEVDFPLMAPHLVVSHLFNNHKKAFDFKLLGTGEGDLSLKLHHFWTEVVRRKDPRIIRHPMCMRDGWTRRAVPIALHGDAVPVIGIGRSNSQSLECFSWQSILAYGPTMAIKFWACGVFEKNKHKHGEASEQTVHQIWQLLTWSLKAMFEGTHPHNDWKGIPFARGTAEFHLAGQPLCTDFFFVVWIIKGDIDWFAKGLGFRAHNAVLQCDWCPADKHGDIRAWPTYFDPDAAWMLELMTGQAWRDAHTETMHLLFIELPYLSNQSAEADELHVLHLGTSQYFLGSVLHLLVFTILGDDPQTNIDKVWSSIVESYAKDAGDTQFTNLTIRSFVDPSKAKTSYPCLKGRGCEVKGLVEPLNRVFQRLAPKTAFNDEVLTAMSHLLKAQSTLDEYRGDVFLPTDKAVQFKNDLELFLRSYTRLGAEADRMSQLLFSAAPKLHWLWHLGHKAYWLNPRRSACFIDEDFVKHAKKLGARCTAGTQLHRVVLAMMSKYRYGVDLELFE